MPVYDDPETLQALESARARLDAVLSAEAQRGNCGAADVRLARRIRQLVDDAIGLLRHAASVTPGPAGGASRPASPGSASHPDAAGSTAAAVPVAAPAPGAGQTEHAQVSFLVREPGPDRHPAPAPVAPPAGPTPALGAARSKQADVTIVDPHAPAMGGKRPPQRPDAVARFLKALTGE